MSLRSSFQGKFLTQNIGHHIIYIYLIKPNNALFPRQRPQKKITILIIAYISFDPSDMGN